MFVDIDEKELTESLLSISETEVCGLARSIIVSGFPMRATIDREYMNEVRIMKLDKQIAFQARKTLLEDPDVKRACKLGSAKGGSGHDTFLRGIRVFMNVTATQVWWLQMGRYTFVDIVSSQSKMHRIRQMLGVTTDEGDDIDLIYNCPLALKLTAGLSTNYLQLKTIYGQRRGHRLKEWQTFCDWIEQLPLFKELTGVREKESWTYDDSQRR